MLWNPFSKQSEPINNSRGFTLVEVIAGIMILGTMLVLIMVSFGANIKQIQSSQNRIQAMEHLDQLLTEWSGSGEMPSIGSSGFVNGSFDYRWRILKKAESEMPSLGASIIRLEIFDASPGQDDNVLASVELLAQYTAPRTPIP